MDKKQKILIIIIAAIVVIGGAIGGYFGYSAYQEKKQQEEIEAFLKAIEEEQNSTINAFNDKINGIVNPLLVADANGQNPSLDNNNDIDALTNAVNELNNVTNDVNSNVILTQEQKNSLLQAITEHINSINIRIQAINDEKAQAEAQAEVDRKAKAEASAKSSGNTSSSKSNSNGSNNIGNETNNEANINGNIYTSPDGRTYQLNMSAEEAAVNLQQARERSMQQYEEWKKTHNEYRWD